MNQEEVGDEEGKQFSIKEFFGTKEEQIYSRNDNKDVKLEDFEIIKVIGRGAFGKV